MKLAPYGGMTNKEKSVANFLTFLNIFWIYEAPVFIQDERDRPRVWTPDFYLPQLGMYVEVCGIDREAYRYRKTMYFKNNIPVIFVQFLG